MKATPENKVKELIKRILVGRGCFYYSATAGPYSTAGIPDFVGCDKGRFFGVEAKKPGGKPTALQLMQKEKILAAGGAWFLVDGMDSIQIFVKWLKEVGNEG